MSLDAEQQSNANAIIAAGKARGESSANITVAIMVALTESGLRNLNHGDRDSLGVFQQRANWGTAAQRTNVTWAANKFFDSLDAKPNPTLTPWMRAQKVQISAFSDGSNYQKFYGEAQQIVGGQGGSGTATVQTAASTTSTGNLFTNLMSGALWVRIGLGALGATLLAIAAVKILDDNGVDTSPIKDVISNARS